MTLEDQVVSLDLAKRLKELGFESESLFYYLNIDGEGKYYIYFNENFPEEFEYEGDPICAFTFEEIFEFIPDKFIKNETLTLNSLKDNVIQPVAHTIPHEYHIKISKFNLSDARWFCWAIGHGYDNYGLNISEVSFNEHDNVLANAAAKMLIYLIENGLIKNE